MSAVPNITSEKKMPVASAIVSTVTRRVARIPLISFPLRRLRAAFTNGIPGITSIRAVMITTGLLFVSPILDNRKTADVEIHIRIALVSILSKLGIPSNMSR